MSAADYSIGTAGARLRDGSLTAVALVEAHLARIGARDTRYHSFVTVTAERALEDAARADRELGEGVDRGPLHGIPIGLKDLIDTAGIRTTSGSRLFAAHVPARDAAVAERLRAAGAVLLGKLTTYEFALVGPSFDLPFPASRNPWNTEHITGGSSSGSAAAVAGGLLRTSIGTDTGGSIRSPASYCGVVGLKPTYDRVSRAGVFPLSPSLDHVGPISASVEEAALTLDAIADGCNATARLAEGIEGRRIAYARAWFANDPATSPAVIAAMDDAVSALSLRGARIEEVSLPDYHLFEAAGAVIIQAEALAVHTELLRSRGDEYGVLARRNLLSGLSLSTDDVALARRAADELARRIEAEIFGRFDALVTVNTLTPALPFSAFDGETSVWTHMRTLPFNLTRNPVLALPIGFTAGLPLGMQVVGRLGDEAGICAIGQAFENATDHAVQRPPLRSDIDLQPA
ncbi:amidase [Devosia sp. Root105]|uniref:amidase n=1 Tax=Devosia sp. Root105 TaxID=1736423 RepID=UPI000700FC85|nr:amidase [Devosia sp. Root105]KQU99483.1 amidase [Devosia sp. Root105]